MTTVPNELHMSCFRFDGHSAYDVLWDLCAFHGPEQIMLAVQAIHEQLNEAAELARNGPVLIAHSNGLTPIASILFHHSPEPLTHH